MLAKSKIALAAAAIVLGAACGSPAKDNGPPSIDIGKSCRQSATALGAIYGGDTVDAVDVCMMDEQAARDELVKGWEAYPAPARARCVQTREYLPGYVEWLACIEMTRDVMQLRKQEVASTPDSPTADRRSSSRRTGRDTAECPSVRMGDDGSINSVINCRSKR